MDAIVQGSPEWFAARLGKVTASCVADVVSRTKTGYSASRVNYMAQLIAERLTGNVAATFSNAAMTWGTDQEPHARAAYSFIADVDVAEVGFVDHPRIKMTGASPDGLVGADGLVEIKCPNTSTHIETLIGQKIPAKYITQMQWQLACTDRAWCDFASFDPRMPAEMQLWVCRVERDDDVIRHLENEVSAFLAELEIRVDELTRLYRRAAA